MFSKLSIAYRPFMSWPVPLTTTRMLRNEAHDIAVAICSADVALTMYIGKAPTEHPLCSVYPDVPGGKQELFAYKE